MKAALYSIVSLFYLSFLNCIFLFSGVIEVCVCRLMSRAFLQCHRVVIFCGLVWFSLLVVFFSPFSMLLNNSACEELDGGFQASDRKLELV